MNGNEAVWLMDHAPIDTQSRWAACSSLVQQAVKPMIVSEHKHSSNCCARTRQRRCGQEHTHLHYHEPTGTAGPSSPGLPQGLCPSSLTVQEQLKFVGRSMHDCLLKQLTPNIVAHVTWNKSQVRDPQTWPMGNRQPGCFWWCLPGMCSQPSAIQYLHRWSGRKHQLIAGKGRS